MTEQTTAGEFSDTYRSDLAIPPGELLGDELRARGLTQTKFARQIGRPIQAVNEIIHGKKAITPETALQIEEALGIEAELWLGLEATYRLTLARNAAPEPLPAASSATGQSIKMRSGTAYAAAGRKVVHRGVAEKPAAASAKAAPRRTRTDASRKR